MAERQTLSAAQFPSTARLNAADKTLLGSVLSRVNGDVKLDDQRQLLRDVAKVMDAAAKGALQATYQSVLASDQSADVIARMKWSAGSLSQNAVTLAGLPGNNPYVRATKSLIDELRPLVAKLSEVITPMEPKAPSPQVASSASKIEPLSADQLSFLRGLTTAQFKRFETHLAALNEVLSGCKASFTRHDDAHLRANLQIDLSNAANHAYRHEIAGAWNPKDKVQQAVYYMEWTVDNAAENQKKLASLPQDNRWVIRAQHFAAALEPLAAAMSHVRGVDPQPVIQPGLRGEMKFPEGEQPRYFTMPQASTQKEVPPVEAAPSDIVRPDFKAPRAAGFRPAGVRLPPAEADKPAVVGKPAVGVAPASTRFIPAVKRGQVVVVGFVPLAQRGPSEDLGSSIKRAALRPEFEPWRPQMLAAGQSLLDAAKGQNLPAIKVGVGRCHDLLAALQMDMPSDLGERLRGLTAPLLGKAEAALHLQPPAPKVSAPAAELIDPEMVAAAAGIVRERELNKPKPTAPGI